MKRNIIYVLGISFFLSSCAFVGHLYTYSKLSKQLIYAIMDEDYDQAYGLFAYEKYGDIPIDTFKVQIDKFRSLVLNNFGSDIDLSMVYVEKNMVNKSDQTKVQIQIRNDIHYGYITVLFEDKINQIANINIENDKNDIPSMTLFWLFGLLPIVVLGYNVYTIRRVVKSKVKRKWLKIIGIVILNVPAFTFSLLNGFKIEPFTLQILLGISFSMSGYANTLWTFGIPVGSIIANYKINKSNNVDGKLGDLTALS